MSKNQTPRNKDGTFPKGVSGNPAGRPRFDVFADVYQTLYLTNEHARLSVQTLCHIRDDRSLPTSARIQAAKTLITLAWGKPSYLAKDTMRALDAWLKRLMQTEQDYLALRRCLEGANESLGQV